MSKLTSFFSKGIKVLSDKQKGSVTGGKSKAAMNTPPPPPISNTGNTGNGN